ncbi:MAG: AbrB/MazE/SpoVT family DNA-binding domain-containing protein [Bacteroidota bacterium]
MNINEEASCGTGSSFLVTFDFDYNFYYKIMIKAKVTTVGASVGIVLPKEILSQLHIGKGDTVTFIQTPNGVEITPYDPKFEEQMDKAKRVMSDYRNALRKLAE